MAAAGPGMMGGSQWRRGRGSEPLLEVWLRMRTPEAASGGGGGQAGGSFLAWLLFICFLVGMKMACMWPGAEIKIW